MRNLFIAILGLTLFSTACNTNKSNEQKSSKTIEVNESDATTTAKTEPSNEGKVIHVTTAQFKDLVYNYDVNPGKWVYNDSVPCLIDFYADWCKPCKMIAPYMEELAAEYKGKVKIYKVNVDNERELASVFQARSIPLVVAVPKTGLPQPYAGAMDKSAYVQIIEEMLK